MPSWRRKVRPLDLLLVLISLAYPFVVYFGLVHFSPLTVGLALVVFLILRLLLQRHRRARRSEFGIYLAVLAAIAVLLMVNELLAIKTYPVLISLSFAVVFGYSLFNPPTIIERFARMMEGELDEQAIRYTRNVTVAWVVFFLLNAAISLWTALYGDLATWTLYNGFISYILIGLMFGGEFLLRQYVKRKKVS
ncbi:hypothetical protein [uncultured Sneathiella sp.]|jgi:uncharacterized membrane protein|uniref:COG4648 family protein n=1 Tax=uncultured Sneathiella sp. TaxID=879315 RepID=UPI0030DD447A|tara:strand:- start:126 stop:704 length:579 start_codon:yes stop_codon:yes gene_type:complete